MHNVKRTLTFWLLLSGLLLSGLLQIGWLRAADPTPVNAKNAPSNLGKQLTELKLSDYRGKEWQLDDFKDNPVIVVAFIGVECPLAKLYSQRLSELERKYSDRKVAFIGVDSNAQDTLSEIAAHARRHNIEFPLLYDGQQQLATQLGATRTPEVFVLDSQRKVRYFGRIDDQYGIGYVKKTAESEPLCEAVDALLAGREVTNANLPAIGCLIGKAPQVDAKTTPTVTYAKHIAPIFRDACVNCHREGQIGPFSMTTYEDVAPWAEMIAEVVEQKRMPPWHANPEHGKFSNDCSLTDEQRQLIVTWAAEGAPLGDPKELPAPRQFVEGWQLPREPDAVVYVSPKPVNVQATGEVRYQYFRVDPGFTEEKWISVAQIVPGNSAVVHHILVFVREKGSRGGVEGERGFLWGYVPGSIPLPYPEGAAKRIPAGSELIFQVHYTPIGTPQTDHSKIGFIFADPKAVEREVVTTSAVQTRLNIPPQEANYKTDAMLPETLPDCELLGMAPHMHLRGKSFRYTSVAADKSRQVLLDVPNYDFNWQTAYRLSTPLKLVAGAKIFCEAVFDNSPANLNNPDPSARVHWGDQTTDEMMIGYFDVMVPRTAGGLRVVEPSPRLQILRRLHRDGLISRIDVNGDGQIQQSEVPQQWKNQFKLLDLDGDGVITSIELKDDSSE